MKVIKIISPLFFLLLIACSDDEGPTGLGSATISISADDLSVPEGQAAMVTVSLDQILNGDLTVGITYGGNALPELDFTGPSEVTIAQGTTMQTFSVSLVQDNQAETEVVTVAIDESTLPSTIMPGDQTLISIEIEQ